MPRQDEATTLLMRAGLNLIQQALSIYDSNLRLVASNRPFREMFNLPETLVTPGARFEDTIRFLVECGEYGPIHDVDTAIAVRVKTARAFEPHYMERQRADGRWISVEGSPLPQGGWVAVYTDITAIKRQEALLRTRSEELSGQLLAHAEQLAEANRTLAATNAALKEARRELAEMEARIRLTTEMMPAHIAHVDHALRYTYSNRRLPSVIPGAAADILGLTGAEAMGPATFAKIEPYLHRALTGGASVFEFTDDTSGRRIRAAFTPDADDAGEVNGVYILSADVTAETQARAALTHTHKRELAAQLTSGMAHDFGNLLTIILGLQSRLQRQPALAPEARRAVEATLAAARRGGVLLDRIASISGHRTLHPVATDMRSFLSDLAVMARPTLPPGVEFSVQVEGLEQPLMIDAGSLQDSLLNLILNARHAIGDAAGSITLIARALPETWLELRVEDTGTGFSEEALERGLDPFFTTKGGAGSGLGLSMVYDQTRLSGGRVRLSNRAEGGASVSIWLPLRAAGDAAPSRLVLLVEDTEEIREDVRAMLRELGHSVIEATSGEEALALADVPGIDFVLSDINLPGGISGAMLAGMLRDRGLMAEIVLMTSLPPRDTLRRSAEAGGYAVLGKPFTIGDLALHIAPASPPASGPPAGPLAAEAAA